MRLVPFAVSSSRTRRAVVSVADPLHQAGRLGPVDEPDGAVVTQEQVVGHLADRGPLLVVVAPDGHEQLVLRRGESHRFGLLVTPAKEPPQPGPQRQEVLVVDVRQFHRGTIPSLHDGLGDASWGDASTSCAHTPVDRHLGTGHIRRGIRQQEGHDLGHLLWCAHPAEGEITEPRATVLLGNRQHGRVDGARQHGVDADVQWSEFDRRRATDAAQRPLGGAVGRMARNAAHPRI